MPSPFPGMDLYIETTGVWPTFHHAFLTACHDQLNERLPANYVATLGERVELIDEEELELGSQIVGLDVAVVRDTAVPASARSGSSTAATLEPRTLPQSVQWLDPPKQLYIQVLRLPERRVVTDIELLSASNKRAGSEDRAAYLAKRKLLLRHEVNLVELDLLLNGERLKMLAPLPDGDYFAFVTRWPTGHECDVYAWSVRAPLPTVPVPLRKEDGAVLLDLASVFRQTYDRGRYSRILRYAEPAPSALAPAERDWVAQRAAGNVR